jgi:hypothetical protein
MPETKGSTNIAQFAEEDVEYPIVKQLIPPAQPVQGIDDDKKPSHPTNFEISLRPFRPF